MNSTLPAGTKYFIEAGNELVLGGVLAVDTEVECVNVLAEDYHWFFLGGQLIAVLASDDI